MDGALTAYETLAPHYDTLTAGYDHDRWIAALDDLVRRHGVRGRRVLDLACGTGKALGPLRRRGYRVAGCDLSPAMVAEARRRDPETELFVADMRALPDAGPFDVVFCLDDAVNYLLGEDELRAALGSVARVLAPGGLLVFDVNTRLTYETAFATDRVVAADGRLLAWRGAGLAEGDGPPTARAVVEIFVEEPGDGRWRRERSEHVQRHWSRDELAAALGEAELDVVDVVGQRTGVRLEPQPDARRHTKFLFLARRREVPMIVQP